MQRLSDLPLHTASIDPRTSAGAAVALLSEDSVSPVAVVSQGEFLGVVGIEGVAALRPDQPVGQGAPYFGPKFDVGLGVREAAAEFVRHRVDYAPVYDEGRFVGLVTARMLLSELGRSWDPMTGLSWSDRLREWGAEALRSGREISVVFFDVDQFGRYNKEYGHVAGDRVLRAVADRLAPLVDDDGILVRYGGDEFVWASARPRVMVEQAAFEALAAPIEAEGVPGRVSVSHGISGGKRTKEREAVHFAATLDNLINLASQACMSAKLAVDMDAKVDFVALDEQDTAIPTAVQLSRDGKSATGFDRRESDSALTSVGRATAEAAARLGLGLLTPLRTRAALRADGQMWVTVTGRVPDGTTREAQEPVRADLYQTAAHAWLKLLAGAARTTGDARA